MEIVIAVIIAIVTGIALMEGYAWLDSIANLLLERAVRHVLDCDRARCREEWSADLQAMPNSLYKIAYALANFRRSTAAKINADVVGNVLDALDDLVVECSDREQRLHKKLRGIRSHHHLLRNDEVPEFLAGILAQANKVSGEQGEEIVSYLNRIITLRNEFAKLEAKCEQFTASISDLTRLRDKAGELAKSVKSPRGILAWIEMLENGLDQCQLPSQVEFEDDPATARIADLSDSAIAEFLRSFKNSPRDNSKPPRC
jgi:hypothetical protein